MRPGEEPPAGRVHRERLGVRAVLRPRVRTVGAVDEHVEHQVVENVVGLAVGRGAQLKARAYVGGALRTAGCAPELVERRALVQAACAGGRRGWLRACAWQSVDGLRRSDDACRSARTRLALCRALTMDKVQPERERTATRSSVVTGMLSSTMRTR